MEEKTCKTSDAGTILRHGGLTGARGPITVGEPIQPRNGGLLRHFLGISGAIYLNNHTNEVLLQ